MLLYAIVHQVIMKTVIKIALDVTNNAIYASVNQINALYVMAIGNKFLFAIVLIEALAGCNTISVIAQLVN